MSVWSELEVGSKITGILRETPYQQAHHFGRPCLSACQLAIAVDRRWAEVRTALGNLPAGGLGTGKRNSRGCLTLLSSRGVRWPGRR